MVSCQISAGKQSGRGRSGAEKRRQMPAKTMLETVFEITYDAKFEGESESEVGISKKCIPICPEGGQPLGELTDQVGVGRPKSVSL